MYIPISNQYTDREEIESFMQQYSFASLITAKDNFPTATHLPFLVISEGDNIVLKAHFAKANNHWKIIEEFKNLVIFTQPNAYISPKNYDNELNVPTWNYIAVHAYGNGKIINDSKQTFEILEATIKQYEASYKQQWDKLPEDYKINLAKKIVAFEIEITDLQAKKKLSQNRSNLEKEKIIETLSKSKHAHEQSIAEYMKKEK
jgi:transcriptional regulator